MLLKFNIQVIALFYNGYYNILSQQEIKFLELIVVVVFVKETTKHHFKLATNLTPNSYNT